MAKSRMAATSLKYPHLSDFDDDDGYDPPRVYGHSRPTRRCFTETKAPQSVGLFYPNYKATDILYNSRPSTTDLRDTSFDQLFNAGVQEKVNQVLGSTGVVYVGTGGPGVLDGTNGWEASDAATFWLLEHNGHLVGVTALHTFRFENAFRIYVNKTLVGNEKGERPSFHQQTVSIKDFVEVKLREDLLRIRERYIRDLHASRDVAKANENIDPEYQLHYGITCDIAFLDLEPVRNLFDRWPRLKLASSTPVVDSMDLVIGFNYGGRWSRNPSSEEFAATVQPPNPVKLYFAEVRSVSLGKVKGVGSGIITDISTMEEMSSGAPKLILDGGELRVIGISVGSYSDTSAKEYV